MKFKKCVINDVSACESSDSCSVRFSVTTSDFVRSSTATKRISEFLEFAFDEHTANMLNGEIIRAVLCSNFTFCVSCGVSHGWSYFNGLVAKYSVDVYYNGNDFLASVTVSFKEGHLSDYTTFFAPASDTMEDTTEKTEDTTEKTEDTTEKTEDTTEKTEDTTEKTEDTTEKTEYTTEDTTAKYTVALGFLYDIPVSCLCFEWCHAPFDTFKSCYNCAFNHSCNTAVKFQIVPLWVYSKYNINPLTALIYALVKFLNRKEMYIPPRLYRMIDDIIIIDDVFFSEEMLF